MSEPSKYKKVAFIPTISFDGIAMLSMFVICVLWFGSIKETVRQHAESIIHIEKIQQTQGEAMQVMAQNIAVLTTLVNERNKR